MRKRHLLLPCLLAAGAAWWLQRPDAPAPRVPRAPIAAATAAPVLPPAPIPTVAAPAAAPPTAESLGATRLDPKSNAFRERLDEVIPARLYAEAARCYHGGLKQDQRLDLSYRIHVEDGVVSVTDLRVEDDTLDDSRLSRCMRDQLLAAKWRDDLLPDVEEEDDLFISGDSLKRFLTAAEPPANADVAN